MLARPCIQHNVSNADDIGYDKHAQYLFYNIDEAGMSAMAAIVKISKRKAWQWRTMAAMA